MRISQREAEYMEANLSLSKLLNIILQKWRRPYMGGVISNGFVAIRLLFVINEFKRER